MVFDYYASGAEDQWSLQETRNAFSRILFRPPILIDVSKIDMSTTVLGFKISVPIMIAPTAMQKMAHPEGIIAFSLNSLEFLKCKIKLFCFVQYFVRRKKFMINQA